MTTPRSLESDHPYFISDSQAELARLVERERVIAKALGGLLPEHADQAAFVAPLQRVLDAGCGTGGWAIDLAQAYPHLQVMGFDSDANMIEYATTQARRGNLEQVSFRVMNALDPLDYPDNFFDLVNARSLGSIGRSAWQGLTQEFFRITRPGGFIRLTEVEDAGVTTSLAFERMMVIFLQACKLGEISFSPTGRSTGIPPMLAYFLRNVGCHNIEKHASIIDWSAGTEVHAAIAQNLKTFFRLLQPFMVRVGAATEEELEQLHPAIDLELRADTLCAFRTFYTIWGQKRVVGGI